MSKHDTGYSKEPLETPYRSGEIIDGDSDEAMTHYYSNDDERFEAVDKLVDEGLGGYDEASRRVGYHPDKYIAPESGSNKIEESAKPGVYIELGERAAAVAELMDGISMHNKAAGALSAVVYNEQFGARYLNPEKVVRNMEAKAGKHARQEGAAVETLAKTAALRAMGFSEADAREAKDSVTDKLYPLRTAGDRTARRRRREKAKTEKVAHIVHGTHTKQHVKTTPK